MIFGLIEANYSNWWPGAGTERMSLHPSFINRSSGIPLGRSSRVARRFQFNLLSSANRRLAEFHFCSRLKTVVNRVRLGIPVASNDNTNGKSSRFKRSQISLLSRLIGHAIACEGPCFLPPYLRRRSFDHAIESFRPFRNISSFALIRWIHPYHLVFKPPASSPSILRTGI